MTKSDKKILWIAIGIAVAITLLINWFIYNKDDSFGARSGGGSQAGAEMVIFDGVQNITSWSADGNHDHIVYESDASDIDDGTSLSVGDIVSFYNKSETTPDPLMYNAYYYVVSVSYDDTDYEDRFEVSSTSAGANLGTISSSSDGGEFAFENFSQTGEMDVGQYEYVNFTIMAEEAPSLSFNWLCSIQDTPPDWYATQSTTNRWEYVDAYDVHDAASIDGDTGIANLNGSDEARMFQVFTNACKWFFVRSGNYASGSVHIGGVGY